MDKVSVIVPIYNVAEYLKECVDSILGQTYRHLEVLLIDDGSPDDAPRICDEYAMIDNRVKVIHKENGGLSDARNVGIEHASGEWLLFVDGDDYIEQNMVETLVSAAKTSRASLAMCGACAFRFSDSTRITNSTWISIESGITSGENVLRQIDSGGNLPIVYIVPWNKLYSRATFDCVRYPVGRVHEDEAVIHHVLGINSRIVCVDGALYNYRQRNDSIIREKSIRKVMDKMEAYADRALFYDAHGLADCSHSVFEAFFGNLMYFYGAFKADPQAKKRIPDMLRWARKLIRFYLRHNDVSVFKRAAAVFFVCVPDMYWLAIKLNHFARYGNTQIQRNVYE